MPIIKSAKKRVKVASKANLRNSKTKRTMREALKEFSKAVAAGNTTQIAKAEKQAVSAVDKAAKKAVIHKNKAARVKARLSAEAKAKGVKPVKSAAKAKPAAKTTKPAAKKPAPKKPTTKKATPKKSTSTK